MKYTRQQREDMAWAWRYFPVEMAFSTVRNYVVIYTAWFAQLAVARVKRFYLVTRINYYLMRRWLAS
jgi:hypothetical protein